MVIKKLFEILTESEKIEIRNVSNKWYDSEVQRKNIQDEANAKILEEWSTGQMSSALKNLLINHFRSDDHLITLNDLNEMQDYNLKYIRGMGFVKIKEFETLKSKFFLKENNKLLELRKEIKIEKLIKDLPQQVIKALSVPFVLREIWTPKTWNNFYNSKLSEVKNRVIINNNDDDLFHIINRTDRLFASRKAAPLDEQLKFIEDFHKRYESQEGMYLTNTRELIDAKEVYLALWPSNTPVKFEQI